MLSLAPAFWPLFWAILAAGIAITGGLSLMIATISLPSHHRRRAPVIRHPAAESLSTAHHDAAAA
jgi:hypothetical protein